MSLPDAGEPLKLADGSLVYPNGKVVRPKATLVEVPTAEEAKRTVVAARRRIADLPAVPKAMNAISVVLCYTLFGLADEDIAIASGLSIDQIGQIKMLDAYETLQQELLQQIMQSDISDVRSMFVEHSKTAAKKIIEIARSDEGALALSAAKDILDRAGHRPADVVEHRHKMEGGLTITVVKKDNDAPTIDLTPEL